MKNIIIIACLFVAASTSKIMAQGDAAAKEKMKAFSAWAGRWTGEGSMQMGPGQPKKSSVTEVIETRLDGMLVVVEGIGKAEDPATKNEAVVHHAFGILSYDPATSQYKFKTYLKDGKTADAWFNVVAENSYQWGFDTPGGKIRYNIVIDPSKKTWNETGEFLREGADWLKFFEMNLTKSE